MIMAERERVRELRRVAHEQIRKCKILKIGYNKVYNAHEEWKWNTKFKKVVLKGEGGKKG